ncbi:MAG: RHS repeat-associated core domain-containing protein [Planctomycetaceae bacterium]|nr:RHS repeat-associated core domain-containing protein [Planctomycetaceae bacterium]
MRTLNSNTLPYDENGNQTAAPKDASTSMTLEYNWDNKLRSAVAGANTIDIKYDPAGNRVYKSSVGSVSSVARKYIVDVVGDLPVILMEIDSADMSIKKCCIYANAEILSEHDGGYNATQYYYLHDRLGSIRQVITSVGSVAKTLTYNPFGETIESYGDFSTSWQFTGQYLDSETGQYYLRARQYSPYLSRFTGRDLIVGQFENPLTLHKYLYCQNDPLNNYDLNGLWKEYIHQEFGTLGSGKPGSLFDYARLDKDYPTTDLKHYNEWAKYHFMSREQVKPYLLTSIAFGFTRGFEYSMHAWQDSYVHWDNGFRWESGGHGLDSLVRGLTGRPDVDLHTKENDNVYQSCKKTTGTWEELWLMFNDEHGLYKGFSEFSKMDALMRTWRYERDDFGKLISEY